MGDNWKKLQLHFRYCTGNKDETNPGTSLQHCLRASTKIQALAVIQPPQGYDFLKFDTLAIF